MKKRDLRAGQISVEVSRQVIPQPSVNNQIRWPILAVVGLAVAGMFWLLFGTKHSDQPEAKSVEQTSVAKSSIVAGGAVPSNASGPQASENGGSRLSAREIPRNANKELIENMSALAAVAGMTEDVEMAIHEVAALGDTVVPELKSLVQAGQNANVR